MRASQSSVPRVGLSYVNVDIRHHADGTVSTRGYFQPTAKELAWQQATVPQMRRGGVRLVLLSHGLNDPEMLPPVMHVEYMLRCYADLINNVQAHRQCQLIRTRADVQQLSRTDRLGIVLHMTGCPVNGSMQALEGFAQLGVRSIHPFHHDTAIGGYWYAPGKRGLEPLGKQIIRTMERLHLLIDTAHASDRGFRDVLRIASSPILDSHAGCRAILPSQRNRTDAQLRAIAATGGVVGVHFGSPLLAPVGQHPARQKLLQDLTRRVAKMRRQFKGDPYGFLAARYDPDVWSKALGGAVDDGIEPARATLRQMVDHVERMIEVAGINHVCIGSDYSLGSICDGVRTAVQLPNLSAELKRRGYSARERDQVLYANLQRLLTQVLPRG